jgi:hypothetical protein
LQHIQAATAFNPKALTYAQKPLNFSVRPPGMIRGIEKDNPMNKKLTKEDLILVLDKLKIAIAEK